MDFQWNKIKSNHFNITNIKNRFNADELFAGFLLQLEKLKINPHKKFTISEVAELALEAIAPVDLKFGYGFSIMSMMSNKKDRDYFIFDDENLREEFTEQCNNNYRDNYYWKKNHGKDECVINPKYIKES